jgi:hypothetical protein
MENTADTKIKNFTKADNSTLTTSIVIDTQAGDSANSSSGGPFPQAQYPYSPLPPYFFERNSVVDEPRTVFSVQTWDGRDVMSFSLRD